MPNQHFRPRKDPGGGRKTLAYLLFWLAMVARLIGENEISSASQTTHSAASHSVADGGEEMGAYIGEVAKQHER